MNFKRKTKRKNSLKSDKLNAKKISHWTYGRAIAKEIVERREFREEKYKLLK